MRNRPIVAAPGMQETDMSVFTDTRLMDGQDDTVSTEFFPTPLHAAAAPALTESDWTDVKVRHVGMTAAPVLAPGRRPFTVGKRDRFIDNNHFHVSSGHLNEHLLRETAGQHGTTLTGELQPCDGCSEAKGVRAGVPRRMISRARRTMETVHIDLAGPYEVSMCGSHHLIMFVDSASRWMRPYGMRTKSETTAYIQTFLADTNAMGRPLCFRTDNGGEFTDRSFLDFCDAAGIRRECTASGKPQQNAVVEGAI